MSKADWCASLFICFFSFSCAAQQVPDTLFNPRILHPEYERNEGPVIYIDEAHGNFHTAGGRFKPFASLLAKDGYVIQSFAGIFSVERLLNAKILVIANALHESNQSRWALPGVEAFSDDEIAAVNEWVRGGGSLFLIADHMPFPGASSKLASSFGFKFHNGFAMKKKSSPDIFTLQSGLTTSILTTGRTKSETITSLTSFTGQAFEMADGAIPVITLTDAFDVLLPEVAWEFTKLTPAISGKGLMQGAFMPYGKGRIVVFGEAAMFTAQLQGTNKFGMNAPNAKQNVQFLLNVIHWLDGKM
jgi:hypothetical protein